MPTRTRFRLALATVAASGLLCGMVLSKALWADGPSNDCLDFLRCDADCRATTDAPDPDCRAARLDDGSAAAVDHQRCQGACLRSGVHAPGMGLYPLSNENGLQWRLFAGCLR